MSPASSAASFQFFRVSNTLKCLASATLLLLHLSMPVTSVALQVSITKSLHHPHIFSTYVHVSGVISRMSLALSASITLTSLTLYVSKFPALSQISITYTSPAPFRLKLPNVSFYFKFPAPTRLQYLHVSPTFTSSTPSRLQHLHVFTTFTSSPL